MHYIVLKQSQREPKAKVGVVVYPSRRPDYGLALDEEREFGFPCRSVTLNADGDYPFFVMRCDDMQVVRDD